LPFSSLITSLFVCLVLAAATQAAETDLSADEPIGASSQTETASEVDPQQGARPSTIPSSGPATDVRSTPHELSVAGKFPLFVSGYVQGRFTDEKGTKYPFRVKRARLILDAPLGDSVEFFVQLDPVFRPSIVLDAYLQLRIRRTAHFRVGAFKVPFGGESVAADEKTIPIERSLVVNSFSPDRDNGNQARDVGIELLGRAGGRSANLVEYSIAAVNGSGLNDVSGHHPVAGAMRVIVHPIGGLSVGADYFQGKTTTASPGVKRREEFEAGYKRGGLTSWGEYLRGNDGPVHRNGGYALVAYRIDHHWETFVRAEEYTANRAKGGQTTRLYETGANYYLTNKIRVQTNGGARKDPVRGDITPVFLVQLQIGL
jgi:hypothetical protein